MIVQADTVKRLEAAAPQEAANAASLTPPRTKLAAALRDLADRIEQQPDLMSKAADLMSEDFMDNRAPIPEVQDIEHCLLIIGKRSQHV